MLSLGLSDVYSLLAFASPFSDARPKSSLLFHTKEVEASAWNDDGVIHDVEEGETVTFDANPPFPSSDSWSRLTSPTSQEPTTMTS